MSQYVNEVLAAIAFEKRLAKLAEQKKSGIDVQTFCQKNTSKVTERPPMMGGVSRAIS